MMKNELEFDFELKEMLGLTDTDERSRNQTHQKITDAIDEFFERLEIQKSLGCRAGELEKLLGGRIGSSDREPRAVSDLREFVKNEKQNVPTMTKRQMRSSMINLLRKAADAMAAI